jgi:hypothetical protein
MTEKEAIILLIYYNDWRRGEDIKMPNPTQIGIALELIIKEYFKRVPMYFQIVPAIVNQKQIFRLYINQQLHSEHDTRKQALHTQIKIENSISQSGKQTAESGDNGATSKPEPSSGRGD